LELIALASGPTERAGQTVQILHVAEPSMCDAQSQPEAANGAAVLVSYRLNETLKGAENANPYVQPGDIITVPEAEQVYVVGNVRNPGALTIKAQQLTLSRAVMMVGGVLPDTKTERVRIIRQPPGTATPTDLYVDLKAIEKKQVADVALQANDIVELPRATGAAQSLKNIMRGFVPVLTQSLPMRIIY
jgi:polysaccharide export outer membrane protein